MTAGTGSSSSPGNETPAPQAASNRTATPTMRSATSPRSTTVKPVGPIKAPNASATTTASVSPTPGPPQSTQHAHSTRPARTTTPPPPAASPRPGPSMGRAPRLRVPPRTTRPTPTTRTATSCTKAHPPRRLAVVSSRAATPTRHKAPPASYPTPSPPPPRVRSCITRTAP